MNESEKVQFIEILTGIGEIYEKKMSTVVLEIYWEALKEYPLDDIKRATNNIVQTHKYATFPKPAEFIEYIDPPIEAGMKAELMTEEFYARFVGSGYESFEWKDPVLAMTVRHYGGWHSVLEQYPRDNEKDAMFWMKDFKKVYIAFLKHPRKVSNLRVVGTLEDDNMAKGYLTDDRGQAIPLPDREGFIMIGSPEALEKFLEAKKQKQITDDSESPR